MKPRVSHQKTAALTRVELVVVIFVIAVLVAMFLSALRAAKYKTSKIGCDNNLKQVDLAYRIWAGDHNDKYPMQTSVTNGGTMEFAAKGDVVKTFQIMSNELSTPKVLYCPADSQNTNAANFGPGLTAKNISYFIGLDVLPNQPQSVLNGDANFAISGNPVNSGLLHLSPNTPVTWTSMRHLSYNIHFWTPDSKRHAGYILFVDGSTSRTDDKSLVQAFTATGLATNRLAIP